MLSFGAWIFLFKQHWQDCSKAKQFLCGLGHSLAHKKSPNKPTTPQCFDLVSKSLISQQLPFQGCEIGCKVLVWMQRGAGLDLWFFFSPNSSKLLFAEIRSPPPCKKEIQKTFCILFHSQCSLQCCNVFLFVRTVGRYYFLSFFFSFSLFWSQSLCVVL